MDSHLRDQSVSPVSPLSEDSSIEQDGELKAIRMQHRDTPTAMHSISPAGSSMPPWLRKAVAERKLQLAVSREYASHPRETEGNLSSGHHHHVSDWLDDLPDRLNEGWETVLREEVEETFGSKHAKIGTHESDRMEDSLPGDDKDCNSSSRRHICNEDIESEAFDICPDVKPIADDYSSSCDDENDGEFLVKVLLGRKRLMQAEISVKRLKMGLKHVSSGLGSEFSNATDTQRTRELLAEVDNTFEEVVHKRLSNATAIQQRADHNDDQKQRYRKRLRVMKQKDPGFILRVYSQRDILELKTMVADILGMDERSGDNEGTDWFWNMLPRLLELRADMAEAEAEMERQRQEARTARTNRIMTGVQGSSYVLKHLSIWDLYFHQYNWMQAELNFRPIGSWYAFSIPPEEEAETEDWQLRIEQRVWLQEHFSLALGTKRWLPFRQAMVRAY